jgi:hypothetical protein
LQWLQDPSKTNGDNQNNIWSQQEFQKKKKRYVKDKINELAMNGKHRNSRDLYRGINEFKKGYHPRSKLVKDENGCLLVDSNILNRWKNYFS